MILASGPAPTDLLMGFVALAYLAAAAIGSRSERATRVVVGMAWIGHAALLLVALFGPAPRFGFAPALSMTVWLVAGVYFVERRFYPGLPVRWAMSVIGAAAVVLGWMFPGTALASGASGWLALHLALGIGSYGLFGAAAAHAWLMHRADQRMRHPEGLEPGVPLLTIERLTFRLAWAGFALLSSTLLLALLSAGSGAGHALRWDHKTVFSILAWLVFAGLLVGRVRFGWRGPRAARMLYAGTGLLFLAYAGSRFVLEVIMGRSP